MIDGYYYAFDLISPQQIYKTGKTDTDNKPRQIGNKQQNEKPAQKEENENMNLKEEFPAVGQKVLLLNSENHTLPPFGEGFVGKEVTVVSKFTTPETDYALQTKMVSVLIGELDGYSGICACFREEMCYPVKTEQEKSIDAWVDLLKECDNIEDVATVLVMNGYHRIKTED